MKVKPDPAGFAALSIHEAHLHTLNDQRLLPEHEMLGGGNLLRQA